MTLSFADTVAILRAVAEPTRLRILRLLRCGEFSLKDMTQILHQSQPRVSRHIKLLAEAGLIERHQEGSWLFLRAARSKPIDTMLEPIFENIAKSDPQMARDLERAAAIRAQRAKSAQTYFDRNASKWDEIRTLHVPERDVEAAMLAALGEERLELVIDAGVGTGRILELFAGHADRLIGIDTNREMLKYARARLDMAGLLNCSVRLGDVYDLPFEDGTADAVIFHQVLHYLETPLLALKEAARVLRPDGCVMVVDFAPHGLEFLRTDHAHLRLGFSEDEMNSWFEASGLHADLEQHFPSGSGDQGLTVVLWRAAKGPSPKPCLTRSKHSGAGHSELTALPVTSQS